MGVEVQTAPRATGLTTVVDTIVAPKSAFERLRDVPTWGWAFLIAFALAIVGYMLQRAALNHANLAMIQHIAANPSISDAQRAKMIDNAQHPSAASAVTSILGLGIVLLLAALFNAAILSLGNAIGRGDADFKRLWSGSMNIAVPTFGIVAVLLGVITMARGATAFNSPTDVQAALPGLQMLAPGGAPALRGFLGGFSIGTIWGLILNGLMMTTLARVRPAVAWSFAALITLLGALMYAAFSTIAATFLKM